MLNCNVLNVPDRRNKPGDRDKALQCILKVCSTGIVYILVICIFMQDVRWCMYLIIITQCYASVVYML